MDCRRSSSPRSAAIIGGNDDLLIEILLFLPAKSLIKFQSVSKHWRSLILSRRFSHLHTVHYRRRHKPQPSLLLRSSITSKFFVCHPDVKKLVPFCFKFRYQKILQSCNGLLLLACGNSPYGQKNYFICNPTTRKYRRLVVKGGLSGLCIAFDPSKSPYYKVFCFRGSLYSQWTIDVYDSESRTWKVGIKLSNGPLKIVNGVYWNDAIYFIKPRMTSYYFSFEDDFDGFNMIDKIPRVRSQGTKKNHVMESNGHMHYLVLSLHPDKNYVYVFEGNKEDCSWFLKYKANLNPISSALAGSNGTRMISLLGIIRGEMEEDSAMLFHVPGKIMVYSLRFWLILQQNTISRRNKCSFCLRMLISSSRQLLLFDLLFFFCSKNDPFVELASGKI
ncbi:hypothetical protein CDL12_15906 [Handroanthus impetiginosus]|uniref:F-box domain-containing protein n=1 Tax=Handroanthus impetiginosus TaxID=429701 RepID=A0A2G9H1S5_9LAMI|nr:hypothetical protein CDL12_15906 [Handroanthus impetiginosus]